MGYEDTKEKIISTLMGRPSGTEIQPANQQDYALSMLEYIRSIELISNSSLIGIANEETVPVQPNDSRVSYIAGIAQDRTINFHNFIGQNGESLSVATSEMECYLIILLWNTEYWSIQTIPSNIISSAEQAYFFYNLTIRKTYSSISEMQNDLINPVGNDGKLIKFGEIVSVHNESNSEEDAIYSYSYEEGPRWQLQMKLSALDSRVFDGGRADSVYGGARNINCGNAQG